MSRFHVIDTTNGEVVKELSRHPSLAGLSRKPRKAAYKPLRVQSRPTTQVWNDMAVAVILTMALCAALCWQYAFSPLQ